MTDKPVRAARNTHVIVVGGGRSSEHDVSIATAAAVVAGLDRQRFDATLLIIDTSGQWCDDTGKPLPGGIVGALTIMTGADVVFPALHGPAGEDGTLAGLCELAGVPYVGSGVRAGALAMDKWVTKLLAADLGIPTAQGVVITEATAASPIHGLNPPLVVKPVSGGSSHGVSRVDGPDDLEAAIKNALALDDRALVEQLVRGREIDIAVLDRAGGQRLVGPPLEVVVAEGGLFDAERKYDGSADFRVPAEVSDTELAMIETAAMTMYDALGCAGVARFDFFLAADGRVVLNEVNTMPGLTPQSQVPKMFGAIGIAYPELLAALVDDALARDTRR